MEPFYDPSKSYEENWEEGPFGAFADGTTYRDKGEPRYEVFGREVYLPFGIPAGPLINGRFMKAALDKGFDIPVYKTVRTRVKKVNQWPNVLAAHIKGNLTLKKASRQLVVDDKYTEPLSITNSFGNPSYPPDVWQKDIADTVVYAKKKKGQIVSAMIEGTRWDASFTDKKFLDDWVLAARLMNKTGVHVIEANFSCPNEGNRVKRLLCFDVAQSRRIAEAIKNKIGDTPLVLKLAYFENNDELQAFVRALGRVADGFSAINTIPAEVVDKEGKQALPGGEWRKKSGICGAAIKWAGFEMTKRLKTLRDELKMRYTIIGVGGVMTPKDYQQYRDAGADIVMSATGSMWNPHLAIEIKKSEKI